MAEEQTQLATNTRISSTTFTGREAAPAQSDPETVAILNRNSLQLSVVANQIRGLNAQVVSLSNSMQAIGNSLATSQALERRKEQQEQAQEARLAQQQLREGQESVIERKIQAKAIAPAQKLAEVARFTLGRLGNFFMTLIGAWLGSRAVDTLNALSQGNTEELNKIKKEVLTGLAAITGVYIGSKLGLRLLTGGFGKIGLLLAASAAVGLFTKPGRDLMKFALEGAKDIISAIAKAVGLPDPFADSGENNQPPPPPAQPAGTPPPAGASPAPAPATPQIDPTKPPGGQNQGGPELPSTPTETMMGQKVDPRIQDLESKLGQNQSSYISGMIQEEEYLKTREDLRKQLDEAKSSPGGSEAKVSAQPQQTMMGKPAPATPPPAEMGGKTGEDTNQPVEPQPGSPTLKAEDLTEEEKKTNTQSSSTPATIESMGNASQTGQVTPGGDNIIQMNAEVKNYTVEENYIAKTGGRLAAEVTPMKKNTAIAEQISQPEPSPAINVVPIPVPSSSSSAPQGQVKSPPSGGVGNVPFFPTGNPDNMFLLSAYSNFNVVPV